MPIHPTAIVDSSAEVDASAIVGPYATIEAHAVIGPETRLYPHAYVGEYTTLGRRCQIHPFAVVGHLTQDLKYAGGPTYARIGDGTVIREHATVNRGTSAGGATILGERCLIMSTAHVGHDCVLGDHVILANGSLLAGHVHVGNRAGISGNGTIHQFTRIGEHALIAGMCRVPRDVLPFMLLVPHGVIGPNTVGLRRAGFSPAERLELRECYRLLYRSGLLMPAAIERVAERVRTDPGRRLLAFLREPSQRGYMAYRRRTRSPCELLSDETAEAH
jgi:UDP-N-acetylglucosamine acyltransferase